MKFATFVVCWALSDRAWRVGGDDRGNSKNMLFPMQVDSSNTLMFKKANYVYRFETFLPLSFKTQFGNHFDEYVGILFDRAAKLRLLTMMCSETGTTDYAVEDYFQTTIALASTKYGEKLKQYLAKSLKGYTLTEYYKKCNIRKELFKLDPFDKLCNVESWVTYTSYSDPVTMLRNLCVMTLTNVIEKCMHYIKEQLCKYYRWSFNYNMLLDYKCLLDEVVVPFNESHVVARDLSNNATTTTAMMLDRLRSTVLERISTAVPYNYETLQLRRSGEEDGTPSQRAPFSCGIPILSSIVEFLYSTCSTADSTNSAFAAADANKDLIDAMQKEIVTQSSMFDEFKRVQKETVAQLHSVSEKMIAAVNTIEKHLSESVTLISQAVDRMQLQLNEMHYYIQVMKICNAASDSFSSMNKKISNVLTTEVARMSAYIGKVALNEDKSDVVGDFVNEKSSLLTKNGYVSIVANGQPLSVTKFIATNVEFAQNDGKGDGRASSLYTFTARIDGVIPLMYKRKESVLPEDHQYRSYNSRGIILDVIPMPVFREPHEPPSANQSRQPGERLTACSKTFADDHGAVIRMVCFNSTKPVSASKLNSVVDFFKHGQCYRAQVSSSLCYLHMDAYYCHDSLFQSFNMYRPMVYESECNLDDRVAFIPPQYLKALADTEIERRVCRPYYKVYRPHVSLRAGVGLVLDIGYLYRVKGGTVVYDVCSELYPYHERTQFFAQCSDGSKCSDFDASEMDKYSFEISNITADIMETYPQALPSLSLPPPLPEPNLHNLTADIMSNMSHELHGVEYDMRASMAAFNESMQKSFKTMDRYRNEFAETRKKFDRLFEKYVPLLEEWKKNLTSVGFVGQQTTVPSLDSVFNWLPDMFGELKALGYAVAAILVGILILWIVMNCFRR